jgi:Protein of unknown function (DUF742)
MRYPVDPDDPEHPAAPGVRPFLSSGGPAAPPGRELPAAAVSRPPPPGEQTTSLRPFVITAGRTTAVDPAIGLETQVTVRPGSRSTRLSPEMRAIVGICADPLSVAEISARLRMHLGVTRILVGDLAAAGVLEVHVLTNDFPDPETIMRVIRGLRAIS